MIEVKHLYKSFEDKDVLIDINAVFENGKTNLIIGQSGSGKTVLMKNLVGLLEPTSGQVLYDGRDFVAMSKREKVQLRREMGMIFQSAALFDSLSVLENVMFPLDMFSSMNYRERVKRAQTCLDRVNLIEAQEKYPGELSGGMQKRVAIARAIALNPQYLFCDEPNSGLDPKTSLVIDDLLHSITQEYGITTIIAAQHHPGIRHHDHHQYPRHELSDGHWRECHLYLRRQKGMAGRQQRHHGNQQQTAFRLYLRQRPAERNAHGGERASRTCRSHHQMNA